MGEKLRNAALAYAEEFLRERTPEELEEIRKDCEYNNSKVSRTISEPHEEPFDWYIFARNMAMTYVPITLLGIIAIMYSAHTLFRVIEVFLK